MTNQQVPESNQSPGPMTQETVMTQKKIRKPTPPDRRLEERFLPEGTQKTADWLVKQTKMELKRLKQSVDTLLDFEQLMATEEVWKFSRKQKFEDFKQFCKSRFGINPDVFFPLLRDLKAKFPYDPFED